MDNCNAKNIEQQVLENSLQIKKILQSLGSALPQPIAGPQGPQGATGERGPKGEEGVGIIGFGSELPLSARLGEWFIRSENDEEGLNYFFYRYVNYHWIRQFSVRGPKGVGGPAGGSEVIVNPEEEATDVLTKIKVDGVVYTISVPQDLYVDNMFANDEIELVDPAGDFGTNAKARIKDVVDANITSKEDVDNKVNTINSSSTNTQYPSAKATFDAIQDVMEVAQGKTKTYVMSVYYNPNFDVQDSSVFIPDSDSIIVDIEGGYAALDKSSLNKGDVILIKETNVPDRWYVGHGDSGYVFNKLETTKVDLSSYENKGKLTIGGTTYDLQIGDTPSAGKITFELED